MTESLQNKEQLWAMLAHLFALIGLLGIPFGNILGPLVVWLVFRKEYPQVDREGRESVNFQISMTLYGFGTALLMFVLVGFLLLPALIIADVILIIMAAVKVNNGETYEYPFNLRLIKG